MEDPLDQEKEHNCLCHLATGDMLRGAIAVKTPLGIEAKEATKKVKELTHQCCLIKVMGLLHLRKPKLKK
ncbi:hypothetical protein AgCh_005382 [Apium graveolens]